MNKQIIVFALLLLITGCNQQSASKMQGDKILSSTKQLKKTTTFYYQVNESTDSIGYKRFEDGEISSIVSLKIVGKQVFLSDPVHGNVKRIDLENRKLTASERLDTDSSWLYNIAYFNNLLYVFTFRGKVYLLDKNLETKGTFFLPDFIGDIDVYSENMDSLVIYRNPSDIYQDNNRKDYLRRMIIGKNNHYSFDTISLEGEESLTRLRKETGKEVRQGDKLVYETSKGKYEILDSIEIKKEYDCKRIDYSDDYLVTFEVNPKRLKLVVYEY